MKSLLKIAFAAAALAFACFAQPADAASPVWKVTAHDGAVLYLGGSVHALRRSDYPLPPAFDTALAESSHLIFETDSSEKDERAIRKIVQAGEYRGGDSLKNHVDPRTYDYLRRFFALLGVPESKFGRYRPWLLTVYLQSPELRGLSSDLGVEGHLTKRARTKQKRISGLVTVKDHIAIFSDLDERASEAVLLMTFIPRSSLSHSAIMKAWRNGDADFLWRLSHDAFSDYPAFGERLLEARNRAWMPKIEGYLRSGEKCFVVVGAAHIGGPEGLVRLLTNRGYRVEQL